MDPRFRHHRNRENIMQIRKLGQLSYVNSLPIYIFQMQSLKDRELIIIADNGFPENFKVEFKFIEVNYIACFTSFNNMQFRILTKQENPLPYWDPIDTLFCFEEFASYLSKEPERYFITAQNLEISVHYQDSLDYGIEHLLEPIVKNNE